MSIVLPSYADWKAPRADGQTLLWPTMPELAGALAARHHDAADAIRLHGHSLADVRKQVRQFVGHDTDAPLIVTGHQAELHHPGVWAKNVVIDALARKFSGRAVHLCVDTDQPKHLSLRWPGFTMPITDDPHLSRAAWTGLLAAPSPAHLDEIDRAASTLNYESLLPATIASIRKTSLDGHEGTELPASLAMAMHAVDWSLGLDYTVLTLSPLLESDGWLTFASHVLSSAPAFGKAYNEALADYRSGAGITSHSRPIPDLVFTDKSIECPFWLDELDTSKRHRATIELRSGQAYLHHPYTDDAVALDASADAEQAVATLRKFLRSRRLRLAPRALTLTLFVRLFLADVFVHGIGGGRYDQVTDRIIAGYFRCAIPRFAVSTATLLNPGSVGRERACLACVVREGHSLKHALPGKQSLVQAIAAAPRKSAQRTQLFSQLQRDLLSYRQNATSIKQWAARLEQTRVSAAEDAVIFDRELYFALQTRPRLEGLIQRFRSAVDAN
jgi:hypothetical protein